MQVMDGVALFRLAAGKANALTVEVLETIERTIDEIEASGAGAAVITGYERFFSGGLPLPLIIDCDRPQMSRFIGLFNRVMTRVFRCRVPLVAAINGHAIAGGCVLALQADVRIMADVDAKIGLNEVQLGIGLPAVVVETLRLAVPARSLAPIAMEGRLFAPRAALELGLVDEVVPAAELEARALARARELAAAPKQGVAQVKAAIRRPVLEALAQTETAENERWLDTWFSPAARARLTETVRKLAR